jgi:hypothetical protein
VLCKNKNPFKKKVMKYNTILRLLTAALLLTAVSKPVNAQERIYDSTTISLMNEITMVQGFYYNTPYSSFDATYYMADIDTVTIRDTSYMKYKMNGDSMYILILNDTVESVQNGSYNATIYRSDSTVIVQKPVLFTKKIFQVDVNDSVFQQMALTNMTVTDSSCYRRITMNFDTNAVYKNMKFVYCKDTKRVSYITYTMRKEMLTNTAKLITMYVQYSNYQTGQFGSSVFSTDPYIKVNNTSDIRLAAGMPPNYEIINLLEQ